MANLTEQLNQKAELYGITKIKNKLGEWDKKQGKIKDVYCNIFPVSAVINSTPVSEYLKYTHKFKVRLKSISKPSLDMYFIYKNQKYQFNYWQQDFKNNEFLEVFTTLILE